MTIFNGDVIKFISYNVHNNQNVIFYGVCLENVDLDDKFGGKLKYLNLYNDCVGTEYVSNLVSITILGNINSIVSKIRLYVNNLVTTRRMAALNECKFLIKERNKGKIYNHTKNKDLDFISNVISCTPLVTSCILLNKGSIASLCNSNSSYNKSKKLSKVLTEMNGEHRDNYKECLDYNDARSCS